MKKRFSLFFLLMYVTLCFAQTIENPAYERSDVLTFHIKKVNITKDTTYVFCLLYEEAGSWASISKETYLRDLKHQKSFPLLRCEGLPFSPETRSFPQDESCELLFCFPSIVGTEQFDFIESEGARAFNIYNVNLNKSYKTSYTDAELKQIIEMVSAYDSSNNSEKAMLLKDYASSISNLVSYYLSIGNYVEAIRLGTVELKIREIVYGDEHPYYIELLGNLADYNSVLGNYHEAVRLGTEQVEVMKKVGGTEQSYYASLLSNLARLNSTLGNYTKAISLEKEAMDIYKRVFGTDHPAYATSLTDISGYYQDIGNYDETFRLLTEAEDICKRIYGNEHYSHAIILNNLADYYSKVGNYSEAIRMGNKSMELCKKILGTEHPLYATSINNLANYNSLIGNFSEAIILGTEAAELFKRAVGTEHPNYAASLNILAINYAEVGNYSEAIRLGIEAMEIYKRVLGTEHPYYAMSLNSLAWYHFGIGDYNESIRLGTEAMEIRKRVLGIEHPLYAGSLLNLAIYNSELNNFSEAIRYGSDAMEIFKRVLGTEHPVYIISLYNLTRYYTELGNYLEAYNCMQQCLNNSQSVVLRYISNLSSRNQEAMWLNKYAYSFNISLPNVVTKYKTKQSVIELYDKTCLFAKSFLLNTSLEMRKLILESGDSVIIDKYEALSSNISLYNKLLEKPIKERLMDVDSLYRAIEQQEMVLTRESKVYGDYTHNLIINWKDVQRGLDDNDIAIEFLDYPIINADSTLYVALTLKKEYDCPHMVTLFEKNQIKAIPDNTYYTTTCLSDLIWKPLEEELKGVKNIFFSPSGELHRIGIEYLPIGNKVRMCDKYTTHRLSSTRQLALIQDETKGKQNILYGGLDYDMEYDTTIVDTTQRSVSTQETPNMFRANVDSLALRASYDYLEGTKKEADQIAADMETHHIPYIYLYGGKGSEESFKNLNGTKPKLIHIATHGFYMTEDEAAKSNFAKSQMVTIGEDNLRSFRLLEDKYMSRSGLLFSGCNHAINHETIPEGAEDGILTAQEISTLDLRGLDLVVLSACQTGLGDITSGEGVFGLQRGFKKAGAKTIIMSLWKVNDDSTMKLMTNFYHHYLEGMSKEEAFHAAQDELRKECIIQQERPDWAAFILLDGLN